MYPSFYHDGFFVICCSNERLKKTLIFLNIYSFKMKNIKVYHKKSLYIMKILTNVIIYVIFIFEIIKKRKVTVWIWI